MDSLTQIVLGAAVGEAVMGRKLGNRAMLWGAVAGTIPDLDVAANFATDTISALVYHRAFTHSLTFAVLASPILGWATHRLYGGGPPDKKQRWRELAGLTLAFFLLVLLGSYAMPLEIFRLPQVVALLTLIVVAIYGFVAARERWRSRPSQADTVSPQAWTLLFFAAIVTHPLLDCCTLYGTQLLEPFTNFRVAWNTIAVADPFYTLPFLIFLILAARRARATSRRRNLNNAGLWISSTYLILTFGHFLWVGHILHHSLEAQEVPHERTIHGPVILSNFLWNATSQGAADDYYFGDYSIFDKERAFQPFKPIVGNHHLLEGLEDEREVRLIRYFTKDFLGVIPLPDGRLQLNDLRYGFLGENAADTSAYLFHWVLDPATRPVTVTQEAGAPAEGPSKVFGDLWTRVKGM